MPRLEENFDAKLWRVFLSSNALEEGWNFQLGYSRLSDVDALFGVTLGLEYHFTSLSIGLMATAFRNGGLNPYFDVGSSMSSEFNISIRL